MFGASIAYRYVHIYEGRFDLNIRPLFVLVLTLNCLFDRPVKVQGLTDHVKARGRR